MLLNWILASFVAVVALAAPETKTITIKYGETITVGSSKITFAEVESDSRCPDGAQCVWPGIFVASLQVKQGSEVVKVNIGQMAGESVIVGSQEVRKGTEFKAGSTIAGALEITLLEANPYPGLGSTGKPVTYSLKLKVESKPIAPSPNAKKP